jgi:hypothetical protein
MANMKHTILFLALLLSACAPAASAPTSQPAAAPTKAVSSAPASSSAASSIAPTRAPVGPAAPSATPARSAITLNNLQQTKQADGTLRTTANVRVQDNLGVGQMDIASPDTMLMGESRTIRLKVSSADQLAGLTPIPAPGKTPDLPQFVLRFSGNVQLYPIMIAELRALFFDIDRQGPQRRDIKANEPATWDWIISPRSSGRQELSIEISIPALINGVYSEMNTNVLHNVPMVIQVQQLVPTPTPTPSLDTQIRDSIINNSGAIIVALIGLLGTLVGILYKMKTRQK